MTGAEAWKKGFMRKDNPHAPGSCCWQSWDDHFMSEMENYYAEELNGSSDQPRENTLDSPSF